MEEIVIALGKWEEIRKNSTELNKLFKNQQGFIIDLSMFTIGTNLHAYPAIRNNELYFVVISEEVDVASPSEILQTHCHWIKSVADLPDIPETSEVESLENRVVDWRNTFEEWINDTVTLDSGMYNVFNIPTCDLEGEQYLLYYALQSNEEQNNMKVADLILRSGNDLYFDTVRSEPPYNNRAIYYLLDLI